MIIQTLKSLMYYLAIYTVIDITLYLIGHLESGDVFKIELKLTVKKLPYGTCRKITPTVYRSIRKKISQPGHGNIAFFNPDLIMGKHIDMIILYYRCQTFGMIGIYKLI